VRENVGVIIQLLEHALLQLWNLPKYMNKGNRSDEQHKKYLANIERLFSYNMGVSPKAASNSSDATMSKWCRIYASKYGQRPSAGERFNLMVVIVTMQRNILNHQIN